MKQLRERTGMMLLAMMASLALVAVGCGDDDPDEVEVDSGMMDAGEEDAGNGGDPQACIAAQPEADFQESGFTDACGECVCNCDADAFTACGEDCYLLIKCVRERCDGDSDDMDCIIGMCGPYLGAGTAASAAGAATNEDGDSCLESCGTECGDFFETPLPEPEPEPDAGTDDDAGVDAGVDAGADAGDAG